MQEFSVMQLKEDPRKNIINEMLQMAENLKDLDKKIEAFQAKDTLTRQDSLDLRSLLVQAEALNALLNGHKKQLQTDSIQAHWQGGQRSKAAKKLSFIICQLSFEINNLKK